MNQCPLCNDTSAYIERSESIHIECRTCGIYKLNRKAFDDLPTEHRLQPNLFKVSIYNMFRTVRNLPIMTYFINDDLSQITPRATLAEIIEQFPTHVSNRADRVLLTLSIKSKFAGHRLRLLNQIKDHPY
ncbi:hypothetical protein PGLA_22785 [Paenibacillus glacialis]|uniref:Uncharacterized protein n=1 Tax=Paenibacillus glacialis TaxID=494026 RepID=A0A168D0B2_9BACL|nr:hypothetical protein PGLA_22785 [Paenibacillus glacialis]